MDPKAVSNLDPKLKETYDRVMGTATPGAPAGAPAPTPPPSPMAPVNADITQAQSGAATPAPTTDAQQATPSQAFNADNLRFQAAIQAPAGSVPVGGTVAKVPGQTSSLLRILYIIAAIVFFIVYTFVWIKVFNLPLPF